MFAARWPLALMLGLALAGAPRGARAQICASGDVTDMAGRASLVLSSHCSVQTPLLLVAAAPPLAQAPAGSDVAVADQADQAELPLPAGTASRIPTRRPDLPFDAIVIRVAAETRVAAGLLRAVMAVESNFMPRALSAKGAMGLMQLMPATARRFGARDPFSPAQNLRAGAQYLRWLTDRFGDDLPLVLAAYNAGEGAVERAGKRIPYLAETRAYVPRVLERLRRDEAAGLSP